MKYLIWGGVILVLLIVWAAQTYFTEVRIEQPLYQIVEEKNGYQIRLYPSYLQATVEVNGAFDEALNEGFGILAGYIFGENQAQSSVAMTAPVTVSEETKIAMTAPVTEEKVSDDTRVISFVLPAKYTLETIPEPKDNRISITQSKEKRVAVISFRGYYSQSKVENREQQLLQLLKEDGITVVGEPIFAGYNSPFAFPLLIKNEVWVEIR